MQLHHNNEVIADFVYHPVFIPLHPGDCMCDTLQYESHTPIGYTVCSTTDKECNTILCDVSNSVVESFSMTVISCDDPPSIQLNVHANNLTQTILANDNTTTSLSETVNELRISLWHFDYSMDIEVCIHLTYWVC